MMNWKKLSMLFGLLVLMSLVLLACGGNTDSVSDSNQGEERENTEETNNNMDDGSESENGSATEGTAELDLDQRDDWPSNLRMGSASVGGLYYTWAGGWASLTERELEIPVNVEVTGGPNHNIQLIETGELDLGMTTLGPAYDAWFGEGDWTSGQEHREYRMLFPMYPSVIHWWAFEESGIESISDFDGHTIGVGPAGGTPGTYLPMFIDILGVNVANLVNAGFDDMASQQQDGLIDVIGWAGGIPAGLGQELEAQREINWIGFTDEELDKIIEELPYFSKGIIEAGTYKTLEEDIGALELYNFAIAHKDIPDSLAYHIVDTVMNNNDYMMDVHIASIDTVPENVGINTFAYMHPGAIKWFEDNGQDLPDEVYPPDYPY